MIEIFILATILHATPDPNFGTGSDHIPKMRQLVGEELENAFADKVVTNSQSLSSGPESFRSDGTYTFFSRALVEGKFWVDGELLCTTTVRDSTPTCRRFAIDRAGIIYQTHYRHGDVETKVFPPVRYSMSTISK